MTYSHTSDARDLWVGCDKYGSPFCQSAGWIIRPPFTASNTLTTISG